MTRDLLPSIQVKEHLCRDNFFFYTSLDNLLSIGKNIKREQENESKCKHEREREREMHLLHLLNLKKIKFFLI